MPANLRPAGASADYVLSGHWSKAALKEAEKSGRARVAGSTESSAFDRVPAQGELDLDAGAAYLHYTSNNTIYGTQWAGAPEPPPGVPLVCDASSDALSRPVDVAGLGVFYAGAQKNLGPAGVTLVVVRKDLLERTPGGLPAVVDYRLMAENRSLYNTPPTFAIYVVGLVLGWLKERGGLAEVARLNEAKAALLYDAIDASGGFYRGHAHPGSRSRMNVTFRLPSEDLEKAFLKEAQAQELDGLKGHRSVGGLRASIYNACPVESVRALAGIHGRVPRAARLTRLTGQGLRELGFDAAFEESFAPLAARGLVPGRVVAGHARVLRVRTEQGEGLVAVAGRLRHEARGAAGLPTVGDWVGLRPRGDGQPAVVEALLPRRTAFVAPRTRGSRGGPGAGLQRGHRLPRDGPRRGLQPPAARAGARPRLGERGRARSCCSTRPTCARTWPPAAPRSRPWPRACPCWRSRPSRARGSSPSRPGSRPARTVALLGSSGVGKSTLVNRLLGREKQKTREVREGDQRGRHTTTHRELIVLPGGALLLDTPGLREIQLWSDGGGLDAAFEDVSGLFASCRFTDCSHGQEPGCAVRAAVEEGRLEPARLASFRKLQAELRALEIREDPLKRREERGRWKAIHKSMRQPKRE